MKLKLGLVFLAFVFCTNVRAQTGFPFADEIRAFKHQDSLNFPKPDGILFMGASSIRLWGDLQQRFSNVPIIQRGVGGSELWQWVQYYMPSIVFPYHPRKIFMYVGENDIAVSHKKASEVFASFTKFYAMIREQLPDVQLYYLSIKPSPSRLKFTAECAEFDKLVKAYLADKPKNTYINLSSPVLNEKMQPDSALFKTDMLHLNSKGYDKWQAVLQSYVK